MFAGAERISQAIAEQGVKVSTPVEILTGYDIMIADGEKAWDLVINHKPRVICMAPLCTPWSKLRI